MSERRIAGPVGDLHVDEGGPDGHPVVFIHSLAGNSIHWNDQLAHLRRGRRAIALDLRGHGRSDTTDDADYSLPAYAADLAAVIDELGVDGFTLVGHSLGAGVAIAYAGEHPARVTRLMLVDPIGDNARAPPDEIAAFLAALTQDYRTVIEGHWSAILEDARPDVRERVLEDLRLTPRRVVTESLRKLDRYDLTSTLRGFRGPALSVITPINSVPYSLHNLLPDLPTETVIGTGHWLHMDQPAVFARILDPFLE